MLFNLFGKKAKAGPEEPRDRNWSFLGTDVHSHLLPGIDDGAQTVEDSLQLVDELMKMGFRSIITTPHIKFDHYPNTRETIEGALAILHKALQDKGVDIPVKAAAEYYIDDHFLQLLDMKDLMPIRGNEVLIEMSFSSEPIKFYDLLFRMQMAGYKPVLAHPERYQFYHNKTEVFRELKERGCLLQLNTISLAGYYGKSVKHVATKLLDEKLYDYCGSDMHHIRHAENMNKVLDTNFISDLKKYPFLNNQLFI